MASFAYTALEPSGRRRNGVVDAPDQAMALAQLTDRGDFVVEIREAGRAASAGDDGPLTADDLQGRRLKASRQDLALFTRRLSDLASAGLPLDRTLSVVGEQSESPALRLVATAALMDVRSGLPVSQALAKFPRLFPPVITETLRAGEASGQFGPVAGRLADFQEKEVARRTAFSSALIYPALLTSTALGVVVFLITFVLPRLSGVFKDLGTGLPTTTKLLLGATDLITQNGALIVGILVAAALGYRVWVATPAGALQRDAALLKLPAAGSVLRKAAISRFARVLGTLLFGGVPILESLRLAGLASGNRRLGQAADQVADDVREGRTLHDAMRDAGAFPPVLTHMTAIGEETGDLPTMLGRVADSLDFEVDTGMKRLTSLFEPVIVVVMGAFVGFVVLSVLMPIFEAQSLVK